MRRAVLADTGPLYAAVDPSDDLHKRSRHELQLLAKDRYEVVVAYPTLLEAYTLVLFRLGESVALHWLSDMESAPWMAPSSEDYRQAAAKVRSLAGQEITLFDATVAAMAARLGLKVWTYDHHFDVMRVNVWR